MLINKVSNFKFQFIHTVEEHKGKEDKEGGGDKKKKSSPVVAIVVGVLVAVALVVLAIVLLRSNRCASLRNQIKSSKEVSPNSSHENSHLALSEQKVSSYTNY